MYPKNAASPEPIAIGAVVQISDGAVQTSGCTVRIKPIGVAEGDGAGTPAYSTDGIVYYTPTQAETNYTSFILIAKKTGCIPACVTVVTTASSVPGRTMPADGSITAAVIATDAIDADAIKADAITEFQSGLATQTSVDDLPTNAELAAALASSDDTMLAAIANVQSDTNDIQTRLPAALESGRIAAALDSASRAAILTQQLIESYAADGAAPTVAQALMMLLQHHQQKSVSGTTVTIKKLDKSTAAGTYTLDDADDPTSITRAT